MARFLVVLVLCLFAAAGRAESRDPQQHFFNAHLGDLKAELDTARQEGKQGILLMFELDDCPFCHRMKQTVLNQSEVQAYYRKHFLIFSMDAEGATALTDFSGKQVTEKKFALENRVRATPVFIFFDLTGKPMTRFTGPARDADEFMALGRYVVEGAYKGMPFSKYKTVSSK